MKWTDEAEKAVSRVPFFVRKRVRKRIEEEASAKGALKVDIEHVESCKKKFLNNMEKEVRGYQVENCFGEGGCPNRAVGHEKVITKMEDLLSRKGLREFLKGKVNGPLKMHHEFRVSISDCPNACSRPQIVDIGLVGANEPSVSDELCSQCGTCVEVCREAAIELDVKGPVVHSSKCVACGQCVSICPTGTLRGARQGYRILVGGKLGRHPQLGRELPGIYAEEEALRIVSECLDHYIRNNREGERFGDVINRTELKD